MEHDDKEYCLKTMLDETGINPAFPFVVHNDTPSQICTGMDLRDYFAAKAMQPLLHAFVTEGVDPSDCVKAAAFGAYEMADAMLRARQPV